MCHYASEASGCGLDAAVAAVATAAATVQQ